jgi:hypothetical protein
MQANYMCEQYWTWYRRVLPVHAPQLIMWAVLDFLVPAPTRTTANYPKGVKQTEARVAARYLPCVRNVLFLVLARILSMTQ